MRKQKLYRWHQKRAHERALDRAGAPMRKMEAYQYLQDQGAGFLANVVLTRHKDNARKLKGLAALVAAGHCVGIAAFEIDTLLIDGYRADWETLTIKEPKCTT